MGVLILKYQENFADNLSELAYGQIIAEKTQRQCFFENDIQKRRNFEHKMNNFNMDYKYLSKNQVDAIAHKSYLFSRNLIKQDKIKKELKHFKNKDKIININKFKIDDICLLTEKIKDSFKFKDLDFITSYDKLDEICSTNSIGLYINKKDISSINTEYLFSAARRLNKYLKKPKLYIFTCEKHLPFLNEIQMDYEKLNIVDWREEFYFLTQCKNKILLSNPNSYSEGLWSIILNNKTYLTTFEKEIIVKNQPENWLKI